MKPILIVQGGQWGSEAKGAVAGYLCQHRNVEYAVRTGATNAGHTVYYAGREIKLQQLPVGFVNPNTKLVIGAGALIDPEILSREVRLLSEVTGTDIAERLVIDGRAGLHLPHHHDRSTTANRHHAIGATGKGCSEALIDRIRMRGNGYQPFGGSGYSDGYELADTEALLNYAIDEGAQVLLEGTQGQLLDLYLGPYPYVTHKQTGPAQWMLEAGLSPALPTEIVLVLRTFPIRVAGNSGPMPGEMGWPEVARMINDARASRGLSPVVAEAAIAAFENAVRESMGEAMIPDSLGTDLYAWTPDQRRRYAFGVSELHAIAWKRLDPPTQAELRKLFELTTVTKKLRRIAFWDAASVRASSRQARPHWVAMTFMNYLFPEHWYQAPNVLDAEMSNFIRTVEEQTVAPVKLVGFGPEDRHFLSIKR